MYLGYGTVPLKAVVTGLKKKKFDGFATIEIVRGTGRGSDFPIRRGQPGNVPALLERNEI